MKYAYVVQHSYESEDGHDEVKFIGVYSSEKNAKNAVDRLKNKQGFSLFPEDCFYIEKYLVDEDHWTEGFITA
ncbi:MAG: hypothetical protein LUF26_04200 [Firmicutes bacterium]|nr:hypothetical protein [Bacillota bacterium]